MYEKIDCEVCRKLYAERELKNPDSENTEPPCSECLPELGSINQVALRVYLACQDQLIVGGMGGVIGINHLAVWKYIEKFNVRNECSVFNRVVAVSQHMVKRWNEEIQEKTESTKNTSQNHP